MAVTVIAPIQSYGVSIGFGVFSSSSSISLRIVVPPDTAKLIHLKFEPGATIFGSDNLDTAGIATHVSVKLPLEDFEDIWRMLQLERPLTAEWTSTGHSGGIVSQFAIATSQDEPVGEGLADAS